MYIINNENPDFICDKCGAKLDYEIEEYEYAFSEHFGDCPICGNNIGIKLLTTVKVIKGGVSE